MRPTGKLQNLEKRARRVRGKPSVVVVCWCNLASNGGVHLPGCPAGDVDPDTIVFEVTWPEDPENENNDGWSWKRPSASN